MSQSCPYSPNCPYCDSDTSEQERRGEEIDALALIEAHDRAQEPEDTPPPSEEQP
jgi:hypothetical protein